MTKSTILSVLILLFVSCSDNKTGTKPPTATGDGQVKPVTSITTYPGNQRIMLKWKLAEDTSRTNTVVRWNNSADSIKVTTTSSAGTDSLVIDSLSEGEYTFELKNINSSGKHSVGVIKPAKAYGTAYINSLKNRPVEHVSYDDQQTSSSETLNIIWGDPGDVISTQLTYTDENHQQQTEMVPSGENKTQINVSGSDVSYRSVYKPKETAIDSFYTGYDKLEVITDKNIYIDNQSDFDKYKDAHFQPGSKILFARGAIFNGQFTPTGSGVDGKPLIITAYDPASGTIYDDENIVDKPIINGLGKEDSPVFIQDTEYIKVMNLEVTNTDGSDGNQGKLRGIHIKATDQGVVNNVTIKYCYVHDVNGKVGEKQNGGIYVNVYGDSVITRFNHLRIENNLVEDVAGQAIANQSSYGGVTDGVPGNLWTDVVFRGNRVVRSGKNAMVIRNSKSPIVEYNTVAYSSRYDTGNSIYNFDTIDCIMQYNESYGNTGTTPDEHERGGFDADWNSEGTIIQYNYSHDNHYFVGIMRKKYNKDIAIRYNISQNELIGAFHYGFPNRDELRRVKIYNNTFYFDSNKGTEVFVVGAGSKDDRTPIHTTLQNNIFYFSDSGEWGTNLPGSFIEDHNLFYNFSSTNAIDNTDVQADPKFDNPGQGGTDIDMKDPNRLSGYQLQAGSPAIDAGTEISNNGGKDFWGHSLYHQAPDIGADEH